MDVFISKNKGHDLFKKHFVIIFDECHRSQFGEMHTKIVKSFKKYHLFGFNGTPIFMPPVSRFGGGNRTAKKKSVIEKLMDFFEKYFGLV